MKYSPVTASLFSFFFLFTVYSSKAQVIYVLDGLSEIFCDFRPHTYYIETNQQLINTSWTVSPTFGSSIQYQDLTTAEILFYESGSYTIIVQSLTVNGEVLQDSFYVDVIFSSFTYEVAGCYELSPGSNCYQVCANSTTTVFIPQLNALHGLYEIIGAESYTTDDSSYIEVMWGEGGSGLIILITGCQDQICFDILPEPVADFTTSPPYSQDTVTVCKGQVVYFQNTSFGGLEYEWAFGDGATSNTYNTTHTYAAEGYYTVSLTASTICSCEDEKQIVVEVLPSPTPTLDCVNSVCPETRQRYTATTNGCNTYHWSISGNGTIVLGGGTSDDFIEVIWHEGPIGTIELAVEDCNETYCSFVNTFEVPIITPDGPIIGDASVCSGELATYTAPYFPGTVYNWQIGGAGTIQQQDGSNEIKVQWANVNNTTNTSVSVQYENCFLECGGIDVLPVSITPRFYITGAIQVCHGDVAIAEAWAGFSGSVPANVSWHLEDEMGNVVFTQPGLVNVFVHTFGYPAGNYYWVAKNNAAAYCNTEERLLIQVTPEPAIPLGIEGETVICPGVTYGYTIAAAGVYATQWTVTDGSSTYPYQGQSIQHTFGPVPPYSVSAIHTNVQYPACASAAFTLPIQALDNYTVQGPTDVCLYDISAYSFEAVSGATYTWEIIPADLGEIKRSELNNVEIFWSKTGAGTVRLQICGTTVDMPVEVHALPVFMVTAPAALCSNSTANISTDQPTFSHAWYNDEEALIGNLNTLTIGPGAYAVEVTDMLGCANTQTFDIVSYPAPKVNLSTAADQLYCNALPGGVVIVANTDGGSYTYEWFKDDVNIGPGGPVLSIVDFGAYHVEVTNVYGCKAISQKLTFKNCCPPMNCFIAGGGGFPVGCTYIGYDFGVQQNSTSCHDHQFQPTFAGIDPNTTDWLIYASGDDLIDLVHSDVLNYSFPLPGYYKILMLSSITGYPYPAGTCGHFQIITDTVRAVADFYYDGHCVNEAIAFEDLTTFLPDEMIASWAWEFDDPASGGNNVSSLQDPTHVFSVAGDYDVTLTVTMVSGCTTTFTATVHISDGPVLMPVFEPIYCENEAMAFSLPGAVYEVMWNFGDPVSGIQNDAESADVFHTFDGAGMYNVSVTAKDIYGCASTAVVPVEIKPNTLSGTISAAPALVVCFGDTVTLSAPAGGVSWLWSNDETNAETAVTESNQYSVLVRDQYYCSYTPPPVFVAITPIPEVIIQARPFVEPGVPGTWDSTLQLCYGTEFEIQAFGTDAVSWIWTHGATTDVLQFTNEGANLPLPGIHTFSVVAYNAANCASDTTSITIEIYALPNTPNIAISAGSGCSHDTTTLQVTNPQAGIIYAWSDGQVGESIDVEDAGGYFVIAINANGCSRFSNTIQIIPGAAVDQIPGGCFEKCDPLTVCLPPLQNVTSYNLYQNGVLIESGTSWPSSYLISSDGSYVFEITTTNGCTVFSDPLDIVLYPGIGSITVISYFDTNGDGIISTGDSALPGIEVVIASDDGMHQGMAPTEADGNFVFEDYPSGPYVAYFDENLLPSQYTILLDSLAAVIVNCDDSIVVSLLLGLNCTVAGPDQFFELCPGDMLTIADTTVTDTGTFEIHTLSAGGCDSVFNAIVTIPDSFFIETTVWVDVDQNGIVSPADTVIPGITVLVDRLISQNPTTLITDQNGYAAGYFARAFYAVYIDSNLLPLGLEVIYGYDEVPDTLCGSIHFDFLLGPSCSNVFLAQSISLCPGDSVLIEGQWIDTAGVYAFLISEPGSACDTTLTVTADFYPAIIYSAAASWNCETLGSIVLTLSGTDPFIIDWSHPNSGGTVLEYLDAGTYYYLITDGNGCSIYDSIEVVEGVMHSFDIPSVYEVTLGDSVWVEVSGDSQLPGISFQWVPDDNLSCDTCFATYVTPLSDLILHVFITDENGCQYALETTILVTEDSSLIDQLYVPNVFTPDDDGINDRWTMYHRIETAYVHELTLFDRWGKMVYYKDDFILDTFEGWDGTSRGKRLNPGVYVYMSTITLGDGEVVSVRGDVTILR